MATRRAPKVTIDDFGRRWLPLSCGHRVNLDWLLTQKTIHPDAEKYRNCRVCGLPTIPKKPPTR